MAVAFFATSSATPIAMPLIAAHAMAFDQLTAGEAGFAGGSSSFALRHAARIADRVNAAAAMPTPAPTSFQSSSSLSNLSVSTTVPPLDDADVASVSEGRARQGHDDGRRDGMRIASLLPSATEIICALGHGDELVGRSHECDHPDWVTELPACTSSKLPDDGTSYEIDERIRAILQEGLSVYRVDADALADLAPDVVLTQSQCEVCAVSEEEVVAVVREVLGTGTRVVSLEPQRLRDVLDDLRRVGEALGDGVGGRRLADVVGGRLQAVRDAVSEVSRRPRVAMIEWIDPLMGAGNWIPELVEIAGGDPVLGVAGRHSGVVEAETLAAVEPDVVIVSPCGFTIERTEAELGTLRALPGWNDLPAVAEGRVHVVDGHQYLNRPGPRIADSAEIVAEILHPGVFSQRYQGTGWRRAG
jgi:iron complex transport system substrate-binding protein